MKLSTQRIILMWTLQLPYQKMNLDLSDLDVEDGEIPEQFPDMPLHNMPQDKDLDIDLENGWKGIFRPVRGEDDENDMGKETSFTSDLPVGEDSLHVPTSGRGPVDFFHFLFDESMWGTIVEETNEYARRKLSILGNDSFEWSQHADYLPFARINKWKNLSVCELKIFVTHLILISLTRKPELEYYWRQDSFSNMPFFGKYMSRDRFMAILANLHVADDTLNPKFGEPGHDALAKLRPFVDMMNRNFTHRYNPNKPNKFHTHQVISNCRG